MSKIKTPINGRLPVFVFPVTCTESRNYSVTDSEGKLKAGSSIEIMIRHKYICADKKNIADKFRIQIFDLNKKFNGKKDVLCSVINSEDGIKKTDDIFEKIDCDQSLNISHPAKEVSNNEVVRNPSLVFVVAAVTCMLILLLPTAELATEISIPGSWTSLPTSINITISQKLIASYILGLLTMVILKH